MKPDDGSNAGWPHAEELREQDSKGGFWSNDNKKLLVEFLKFLAVIAVGVYALKNFAADIAIVTNKNFQDLHKAAVAVSVEIKSSANSVADATIYELDGSQDDSRVLIKLKADNPQVVIALGVYAAKMTRQALPEATIIYTSVRYPECENFTSDKKMIGIMASGSEEVLAKLVSSFTAGRTDFASAKKIAVMYSDFLEPSVKPMIEKLKQAGLDPKPMPLSEAPLLELVMQDISNSYQSLLLIPDKTTTNEPSLRFILTRCMEKRVLTFSLDYSLVEKGVLCGVFTKPEECVSYAAVVARNILASGKLPAQNVLTPPKVYTVMNQAASKYMGAAPNLTTDFKIE